MDSTITFTMKDFVAFLSSAHPEEIQEVRTALGIVTPVASKAVSVSSSSSKPGKVQKAPFPAHTVDRPTAENYRFPKDMINHAFCIAREVGNPDDRFFPKALTERPCGEIPVEGSDLCAKCLAKEEIYKRNPGPGSWVGRITEEPLDWQNMLGTTKMIDAEASLLAKGRLFFTPRMAGFIAPAGASSSASTKSTEAEDKYRATVEERKAKILQEAAEKEAAKAAEKKAKEDAKAAEKALKAAEKEAKEQAKALLKQQKEALKAAEKEAKEFAKSLKKPASVLAATIAVKKPVAAPASAAPASDVPASSASVASEPPVADSEKELLNIDYTTYVVVPKVVEGATVFEYDEVNDVTGKRLGVLTGNGDEDSPWGIDTSKMDESSTE